MLKMSSFRTFRILIFLLSIAGARTIHTPTNLLGSVVVLPLNMTG